ncbi:sucrose phosphorylase [Marispirochaeta aestuarii]|uniref:sucrose phosphorylase n=1 Tax=Marispirochaeta aestuarii TaxID=1963862 RepID=UPI0029C88C83|nr:sucrose phosphorylase [Marispirochaeta aestuarii]
MRNGCQLITYPDSMGGSIASLKHGIEKYFSRAITGVHILPFYPSSGDRGFSPLGYDTVDPSFGSWDDIRGIKEMGLDLTVDFMINHLSRRSAQFQDFLRRGKDSPFRDFFIRYSSFWPGGEPTDEDLAKIYTRKPRPPYVEEQLSDGTAEKIWCTFDTEQIDLNLDSPATRNFVQDSMMSLCRRGADCIRLDAFAYGIKRPGTSCFFVEPDVWDLLSWCDGIAAESGAVVLPEIHEHHGIQLKLAQHGYLVYDFALPMLILQAIYDGSSRNLSNWLAICPRRQITTLDTHDGIGVVDVRDLMTDKEIEATRDNLYSRGANVKRIYNTPKYNNLDIYQINCTYYSALGDDDEAYLLARAVQFFAPGIPQVYYVGLLAGRNDITLLEKTKNGRDINRHSYSLEEIDSELGRPVVQRLLRLMEFRSSHPAFSGVFTLKESSPSSLHIEWHHEGHCACLRADLNNLSFRIEATGNAGTKPSALDL